LAPAHLDRFIGLPQLTDPSTGVLVGTLKITHCTRGGDYYHWHLADVKRLRKSRKPKRHPQPRWWRPF